MPLSPVANHGTIQTGNSPEARVDANIRSIPKQSLEKRFVAWARSSDAEL